MFNQENAHGSNDQTLRKANLRGNPVGLEPRRISKKLSRALNARSIRRLKTAKNETRTRSDFATATTGRSEVDSRVSTF